MDQRILQEAGLTETQARAYSELVIHSPCSPPKLSALIGESRTNTYKLLEQLEEIGLASRDETQKKLRYWANNPSLLVDMIDKRRLEAEAAEKRFRDSLPSLMDAYFKHSERPRVQYFQGVDGIQSIYDDQIKTGETITLVRTAADIDFFGSYEAMAHIRSIFNRSPISRHMFTPDSKETLRNWKENDQKNSNTRVWLKKDDYTAPVEWAAYGNKLAITSFGSEAIGIIIESAQIAEAFRQIMTVLADGAKRRPGYKDLPTLASK